MINTRNASLLLGLGIFGTLSASSANAQFVVSYFNFNSLPLGTPDVPVTVDVTTITPNQGSGSLSTNFNTLSTGSSRGVTGFSGTTNNREGTDPAGQSLVLQRLSSSPATNNNGKYIELRTNATNYKGLTLSFSTQRTSTGFTGNQLSYSTDGGVNFIDFGSPYVPANSFATQSFDFTNVTALNNKSDVRFRITFNGGTSDSGNNRIDNLKVVAATPAPSSVAVMALGGLMPMVAVARRRRTVK